MEDGSDPDENERKHLDNLFEYLCVEEPEETDDADDTSARENPARSVLSTKATEHVRPGYKLESSEEDISFAIFCFLKDCFEVRLLVHKTWREYRLEHIALTTAAITMNAAIEILRQINERFLQEYPDFEDHNHIVDFLRNGYIDAKNGAGNTAGQDASGWYNLHGTYLSPQSFVCQMACEYVNYYLKGSDFSNPRNINVDLATDVTKCRSSEMVQVQVLLMELALLNANEVLPQELGLDKFNMLFAAYRASGDAGRALSWTVFAIQMFVDMRRELASDIERPFNDMRSTGDMMRRSGSECIDYGKTHKGFRYSDGDDSTDAYMDALDRFICHDVFVEELLPLTGNEDLSEKIVAAGPFFFLRNDPLLCGLLLQKYMVLVHYLGVVGASRSAAVLAMIHLYNAVLADGALRADLIWADLEYVIKDSEAHLFVGKRPCSAAEYNNHFLLAFGLASAHRKKISEEIWRPTAHKVNVRHLKFPSAYVQQICVIRGKTGLQYHLNTDPAAQIAKVVAAADPQQGRTRGKAKRLRHRPMSPLQTLHFFKQSMFRDQFALRFDFLSLNNRCLEAFRTLQDLSGISYHRYGADRDYGSIVIGILTEYRNAMDQPDYYTDKKARISQFLSDLITREGNREFLKAQEHVRVRSGPITKEQTLNLQSPAYILSGNGPSHMDHLSIASRYGQPRIEINRAEGTYQIRAGDSDAGPPLYNGPIPEDSPLLPSAFRAPTHLPALRTGSF